MWQRRKRSIILGRGGIGSIFLGDEEGSLDLLDKKDASNKVYLLDTTFLLCGGLLAEAFSTVASTFNFLTGGVRVDLAFLFSGGGVRDLFPSSPSSALSFPRVLR